MSSPCECGSYAINIHCHGRDPKLDTNLCDVCYWRARAAEYKMHLRRRSFPEDWDFADMEANDEGVSVCVSDTNRG